MYIFIYTSPISKIFALHSQVVRHPAWLNELLVSCCHISTAAFKHILHFGRTNWTSLKPTYRIISRWSYFKAQPFPRRITLLYTSSVLYWRRIVVHSYPHWSLVGTSYLLICKKTTRLTWKQVLARIFMSSYKFHFSSSRCVNDSKWRPMHWLMGNSFYCWYKFN